jgi:N-acetylmuramoyl-L-alanine amidase
LTWAKVKVILTRKDDSKPSNPARCKIANDGNADIYVSIHCNSAASATARGLEIIHAGSTAGKALAADLLDGLKGTLPDAVKFRKPPIKADNELGRGSNFKLTVLHSTKMPSALVELSFISNKEDRDLMTSHQDEFAQGIADGIVRALKRMGLPIPQDEPKPAPRLESGPISAQIIDNPKPPDPQVRERTDEPMSPEVKTKTDEALALWDEAVAIFKDGKVEPAEFPGLLVCIGKLMETVATILALAKVDPKVGAILGLIAGIIVRIADGIKTQSPRLTLAWGKIQGVLNDKKVDAREAPILIAGVLELTQAMIAILAPWLDAKTIGDLSTLADKIAKVLGWLRVFGKPEPATPKFI